MNATDLADLIGDLLLTETTHSDSISSVRTYADAGILTTDDGLVVTTTRGVEFQITIKRSR
jgi:hypothetical protein